MEGVHEAPSSDHVGAPQLQEVGYATTGSPTDPSHTPHPHVYTHMMLQQGAGSCKLPPPQTLASASSRDTSNNLSSALLQDSGTASTTVCSSTSSSPASIMLAQGPNIPSQPRGQPPPPHHPPPHPLPHPQNNPRFDQPFPRRQPEPSIQENSYAEIPYGSLPVNNLDVYNQHKPDPRTNDWKNGNLINIALGQEYPRRTSTNGGPHGDSYRGPDVVGPRVHTNSSLVHLRDGPDGLHRVPDPRMATVDLPTPDFTCTHITPEKRKKKKGRHALLHVIVMALAGIAYIGLGALAGYYFGKSSKSSIVSLVHNLFLDVPQTGD